MNTKNSPGVQVINASLHGVGFQTAVSVCAETASGLGLSLEQVAKRNIEKLKARYPQGFEVDKSIHRREYER